MNKFLDNLKHLPTTIVGAASIAALLVQDPTVQAAASLNPKVANALTTVGAVSAGLMLIFGAGAKK